MFLRKLRSFFSKTEKGVNTQKGILKYFNRSRGYGFIRTDAVKKDVFVHVSEFGEQIKVGDEVRFEVEQVPKGYEARNVELAEAH